MTQRFLKISALAFAIALPSAAFADDHANGDPKKGKKVFRKCAVCHDVSEKMKVKQGPPLLGIVDRKVGSVEGYKYSKGFVAFAETGAIWDEKALDGFLKNPKKYVRKTLDDKKAKIKMVLKLKKDKERANVIAYLKSLKKPAE